MVMLVSFVVAIGVFLVMPSFAVLKLSLSAAIWAGAIMLGWFVRNS